MHEAFINAISAEPEDDFPRLVYADWLEDNGDLERAEFIRLQCHLARLDEESPQVPALRRREAELLGKHARRWLRPLLDIRACHDHFRRSHFRRGFPAWVHFTRAEFVEHGGAIFAAAPVGEVQLSHHSGTIAEVVASSWLGRCRSLALVQFNDWSADDLGALFSSPHLPTLRSLSLGTSAFEVGAISRLTQCARLAGLSSLRMGSVGLDDEGILEFTRSPHLGGLTELSLSDARIRGRRILAEGVGVLCRSETFARLTSLCLHKVGLGPHTIREMLGSPARERLTRFDFSANMARMPGAGDEALAELARAGMPRLAKLSFHSNAVTASGLRALAESRRLPSLRALEVNSRRFGSEHASALASWRNGYLRHLSLRHSHLDDAAARILAEAPALSGLHSLALSGNYLESVDLATSGMLHNVRELWLDGNNLNDTALKALTNADLPDLVRIHLDMNWIGPAGAAALAAAPWLSQLRELNLLENPIGDPGCAALAGSSALGAIVDLNLMDCEIGDEGAIALARSPHVANLRDLDLGRNRIGERGARALAESPFLDSVEKLTVGSRALSGAGRLALCARFGDRVRME